MNVKITFQKFPTKRIEAQEIYVTYPYSYQNSEILTYPEEQVASIQFSRIFRYKTSRTFVLQLDFYY